MRRLTALAVLLTVGFAAGAVAQNATPAQPAQPASPSATPEKKSDKADKPEKHSANKGKKPEERKDAGLLAVGAQAPEWTLKDAAGKEHKLSEFKGKVVVMDFWATWCGPCKKAMPSIQKTHEKFKDKGVVVIGVSTWEKDGDPVTYMKEKGFNYSLYLKGDEVAKQYGVTGIPAFFVIGGDGKIVFAEQGFDPSDEKKLEKVIEQHLASGKV